MPRAAAEKRPPHEPPPGLPVAEKPLPVAEVSAEVHGRPAAEEDRTRVRGERGDEGPEGDPDSLEDHPGREGANPGNR